MLFFSHLFQSFFFQDALPFTLLFFFKLSCLSCLLLLYLILFPFLLQPLLLFFSFSLNPGLFLKFCFLFVPLFFQLLLSKPLLSVTFHLFYELSEWVIRLYLTTLIHRDKVWALLDEFFLEVTVLVTQFFLFPLQGCHFFYFAIVQVSEVVQIALQVLEQNFLVLFNIFCLIGCIALTTFLITFCCILDLQLCDGQLKKLLISCRHFPVLNPSFFLSYSQSWCVYCCTIVGNKEVLEGVSLLAKLLKFVLQLGKLVICYTSAERGWSLWGVLGLERLVLFCLHHTLSHQRSLGDSLSRWSGWKSRHNLFRFHFLNLYTCCAKPLSLKLALHVLQLTHPHQYSLLVL